jgi:tRNA G10  N-methylase Trm11
MTYFLILGNNPSLSIAEISACLSNNIKKVKKVSEDFLILETKQEIEAKKLQKEMGGIVKIGEIKKEIFLTDFLKDKNLIPDFLEEEINNSSFLKNKIIFGFSFYGFKRKLETKETALIIKQRLKNKGISSRWISCSEKALSTVILKKNKILEKGLEICFFQDCQQVFLGKTLTCQPWEEYSQRDFGRPERSIEKGMIPPKLARIMINLGKESLKSCFLDPFCGSGTFIQEAFLMDFKSIIGTDKDEQSIIKTKKNLAWISKRENKSINHISLFRADVRKLSKKIRNQSISLIATEPYLGPLTIKEKGSFYLIKELSSLYEFAFKEFKALVKPQKKVVIIFPVLNTEKKQYFLPILDSLKNMGWQRESLINPVFLENKVIKMNNRSSIIYSRPEQKVLREIFVFKNI